MAILHLCSRLFINISQVYFSFYITQTQGREKVSFTAQIFKFLTSFCLDIRRFASSNGLFVVVYNFLSAWHFNSDKTTERGKDAVYARSGDWPFQLGRFLLSPSVPASVTVFDVHSVGTCAINSAHLLA